MENKNGIRMVIGVISLLMAIWVIGQAGFGILSQILTDKQEVDCVGYYAIDKDEYCAVAEIKQNGDFSLFTTQDFGWAQGKYYMESEFEVVSPRQGIIKIYDDLFHLLVAEFSDDEEKVMRLKYTLGTNDYDELYHAVSREEYISMFAKVSDRLYERYDEISERLPEADVSTASAAEEEAPAEEAATTEQENERDKYTDEEWFLTTVDGGVPHGFTREDRGGDDIDYIHAGGRSYNFLGIQLAKDLRVWAEEKEKEEGEGYWADEHIEGITDSSDVEWTMRHTLSLLDRRALVRYVEEVMESGLWEELRSYVGDERADEMDQELYELIQNERDIFARMAEQSQKKE